MVLCAFFVNLRVTDLKLVTVRHGRIDEGFEFYGGLGFVGDGLADASEGGGGMENDSCGMARIEMLTTRSLPMTIDSHQHFWDYTAHAEDYVWISNEYGTVAVQASEMMAETDFLLDLADSTPWILGSTCVRFYGLESPT